MELLSDFVFCYLILKSYLHKMSLCNPLLLQMSLSFCCYVIKINIISCTFQYMDEYMKHCIQIFYDVCMNICSVTSCEDKTIKPHRDARLFNATLQMQVTKQDFCHLCWDEEHIIFCTHKQFSLNMSNSTRDFPLNRSQVVMTHLSLKFADSWEAVPHSLQAAVSAAYLDTTSCLSLSTQATRSRGDTDDHTAVYYSSS